MLRHTLFALILSAIPNAASGSCDLPDAYAALSCRIGLPPARDSFVAPIDNKYRLPATAISSSDSIESFADRNSRFSKVPAYLAPIYERVSAEYDIPVKYLVSDGSYETHFNARALGDHGTSCGLHQFHRHGRKPWPQNWGFKSLEDCFDTEENIQKVGEFWRSMLDNKNSVKCSQLIECAIRHHNGSSSYGYARVVMHGADTYYE